MREVELPISKSVANRLLVLQALHRQPLLDVSGDNIPDDVVLLHDALLRLNADDRPFEIRLDLKNCGTAMRFLTAYCAQLEGADVVLDGCERMRERPILQLVDALLTCGADIRFLDKYGYPPLQIRGKHLNPPVSETSQHAALTIIDPVSTQFVSALLLIGVDVESNMVSPYITMTRQLVKTFSLPENHQYMNERMCDFYPVPRDWSSAAFWYEYITLHGGEMLLRGLYPDTLQGDFAVKDIFCKLGVETSFSNDGTVIRCVSRSHRYFMMLDFRTCPDLYPAVAITCHKLGVHLLAIGTESLQWKESNRLRAVREQKTYHDHRIAMALLAADLPCDDTECISKSYPQFVNQLCMFKS